MQLYTKGVHYCWWCGGIAQLKADMGYGDHHDIDYYQVFCQAPRPSTGVPCYVMGPRLRADDRNSERARSEAIRGWNEGDVRIPLQIVMPKSCYMNERVALPTENQSWVPSRMVFLVSTERGIADRLKSDLRILFGSDGTIYPHRFRMWHDIAHHTDVRLISIGDNVAGDRIIPFTFEAGKTDIGSPGKKTDTAWLLRERQSPPIYQRIVDFIGRDEAAD